MFTLNCKGKILAIDRPLVMGIINLTPDSFYAGSRAGADAELLRQAERMITDGVAILDLGGQSTRPGSSLVLADEERQRVVPAIERISREFPHQLLSVDTFYAAVAKEAVAAGAAMINDVSGGADTAMTATVAHLKVPYVFMHIKGTPQTMQQHAEYENVTLEVFDALAQKLKALEAAGVQDVMIDPGFGFAKTTAHNFTLLRELAFLQNLGKPLLVGLSRKGTVYKTLGTTADKALNGSTVLHTIALLNGATILRVHDVKEAVEAVKLVEAYGGI